MSKELELAEANVTRFRRELTAHLNDVVPNAGHVVIAIEGLIIAHIQKTIASVMGSKP